MKNPPPTENFVQPKLIPVILKLKDAYRIWRGYLPHFAKTERFTIGAKTDEVFLLTIEYCFLASYSKQAEKLIILDRAISRLDLIKLLLQLAWETEALEAKKYFHLGAQLVEAGRMLGGWKRQLLNKTPAQNKAGEP